uniref:SH2 domain-containing protein n=1 Tax=Parastrongyloides trichosuri TaxID=131310 RepID=A0A0N5A3T6_PARTI
MASLVKLFKANVGPHFFGKILKDSEINSIITHKSCWPKYKEYHTEGGDSGSLTTSTIVTKWNNENAAGQFQSLEFPDIIKKCDNNKYLLNSVFLKPLDGDIVYSSKKNFLIIFKISQTGKNDFIGSVLNGEILIEQGIIHTPPVILEGNGEVNVIHRQTNGFSLIQLGTSLNINLGDSFVDNNLMLSLKQSCKQDSKKSDVNDTEKHNKISSKGTNKNISIVNEECSLYEAGSILLINEQFEEVPDAVKWENSVFPNKSAKLIQTFKMSWTTMPESGNLQIQFNGLTGSFAGAEGNPGVVYEKENNEYMYKLLLTRPDGSFFVRSITQDCGFIMSVVPPLPNGEPDFSKLQNIKVPFGYGVRLNPFVWHSVPFPEKDISSITLEEIICETNASVVINSLETLNEWIIIQA